MNRIGSIIGVLAALGLAACDNAIPQVNNPGSTDIRVTPAKRQAKGVPTSSQSSLTSSSSSTGACESWVTVKEQYDETTGKFEYDYSCAKGGDIASISTVGQTDLTDGSGGYTTTYLMRDGSQVVWTATYTVDAMGVQTLHSTSSQGEQLDATYEYYADGSTKAHETYTLKDGIYVYDGVYEADGRFNGTVTFDDPNTPEKPDYTVVQTQTADGVTQQDTVQLAGTWTVKSHATYRADGSVDYTFESDDSNTKVGPDVTGAYSYDATGAGKGSYTEFFDDGSRVVVNDVIAADGTYVESWQFIDADPAVAVDQDGSIKYAADGSGKGTITDHLTTGDATCDITVGADGSSSITNCR
jgi:hypothetical protein